MPLGWAMLAQYCVLVLPYQLLPREWPWPGQLCLAAAPSLTWAAGAYGNETPGPWQGWDACEKIPGAAPASVALVLLWGQVSLLQDEQWPLQSMQWWVCSSSAQGPARHACPELDLHLSRGFEQIKCHK